MVVMNRSSSRRAFLAANTLFLTLAAAICLFPMIHLLALSFSSARAAAAGRVSLFPIEFTLSSYRYVAQKSEFWRSFAVSLQRIAIALPLTLIITVLAAYPLSKNKQRFHARPYYTYFFLVPMLFSGGLIPLYLVIRQVGLIDRLLGLILPQTVVVFYCILLMNFFRDMPKEIEEAAIVDGAGPIGTLVRVILPLATPPIATIALFIIVGHWNEWFMAIIIMNTPEKYPLQTYLQSVIAPGAAELAVSSQSAMSPAELARMREISDRTFKSAQIFVAMIPVLMIYPFLQKYFTKGLVLGSVKG
jgi:putative aldouronate transport system permease protein